MVLRPILYVYCIRNMCRENYGGMFVGRYLHTYIYYIPTCSPSLRSHEDRAEAASLRPVLLSWIMLRVFAVSNDYIGMARSAVLFLPCDTKIVLRHKQITGYERLDAAGSGNERVLSYLRRKSWDSRPDPMSCFVRILAVPLTHHHGWRVTFK